MGQEDREEASAEDGSQSLSFGTIAAGGKAAESKAKERPTPRRAITRGLMEGMVALEAAEIPSCWGRMGGAGPLFFVEEVDFDCLSIVCCSVLCESRSRHGKNKNKHCTYHTYFLETIEFNGSTLQGRSNAPDRTHANYETTPQSSSSEDCGVVLRFRFR